MALILLFRVYVQRSGRSADHTSKQRRNRKPTRIQLQTLLQNSKISNLRACEPIPPFDNQISDREDFVLFLLSCSFMLSRRKRNLFISRFRSSCSAHIQQILRQRLSAVRALLNLTDPNAALRAGGSRLQFKADLIKEPGGSKLKRRDFKA